MGWLDKKVSWLRKNINKYSRKELAKKLHKTENQIRGACYYFKIKKITEGKKVRRLKIPMTKQEYQKMAYQKRKNENKKDNN